MQASTIKARRAAQTLFAALLLFASSSCSKHVKPADEQVQGQVQIPSAELDADVLAQGRSESYKGSAVIFAKSAAPEQIARIADGAKASRQAKSAWVGFKRREVDPLRTKEIQLTTAIRRTESEARQDQGARRAQEAAAGLWIDGQWAALGKAAVLKGDERQAAAKAVFARYCEAKVWELAVSSLSLQTYTQRPSPLILCEATFEAKGFFQGESCAASVAGKSYFSCIWKEGLLKTSFFVDRYQDGFAQSPEEKKGQKLAAWVDDGTLQGVLAGDKAEKLVNAALAQKKLVVGSVLGVAYKDAFVPDAGTPAETPELALAEASPVMLLSAVEDGQVATTPPSLIFAARGDLDAAGQGALDALHEDLKAMAQRESLASSASDFLFNHPVSPVPEPARVTTAKGRQSFRPIFDAMAPEFKTRLAELVLEHDRTLELQETQGTEANRLFEVYTKALLDGAIAASEGGATDALWINVKLDVAKPADGLLKVTFQLDEVNATVTAVCLDAATRAEVDCPASLAGDGLAGERGHVEHDAASGLLAFEMMLGTPEPLGFALTAPPPPGSGNPFSLIDPAELREARLRLELYPNRDAGTLDFYSGRVLIKGPDEQGKTAVLHEGATNLMAD